MVLVEFGVVFVCTWLVCVWGAGVECSCRGGVPEGGSGSDELLLSCRFGGVDGITDGEAAVEWFCCRVSAWVFMIQLAANATFCERLHEKLANSLQSDGLIPAS